MDRKQEQLGQILVKRGLINEEHLQKALDETAGEKTAEEDLDWLENIMEEQSEALVAATPLQSTFKAIYLNYFRPIYLIPTKNYIDWNIHLLKTVF